MTATLAASAALSRLAADYWDFFLFEQPMLAIDHGDPRARRVLFRDSLADYERRDARMAEFLARLEAIDASGLGEQDRYSFELLKRELEEGRARHRLDEHLRPTLFPFGPEMYVAFAINKTVVDRAADADDYLARLATVPGFLRDVVERLEAGAARGHRLPAILRERVLANARAFTHAKSEDSIWYSPLRKSRAQDLEPARAAARTLIDDEIRPAYVAFAETLGKLFDRACRDTVGCVDSPDGRAYYDFLAKHHTTVATTPEDIHEIGLAEVARISAEMAKVAAEAGHADVAAFVTHLKNDKGQVADSAEQLRTEIEVLSKRIDRRIPEFFGLIPRMSYGVESIPAELSAAQPPAYAQPNPANNATSGIHWITGLPAKCPRYMHVPLAMHEAWPGHLMHLALLQEITDLPAFRRFGAMGYNSYLEGWALYCERLGIEFGLYTTPASHYGRLEMEIWRAIRLVVDTGLHLKGWTRQQAIDYMRERMALPLETIEAEVDRYIGMPGQALAYKIGELKIRELRQRAEDVLGPAFRLRDFHDRLMTAGPVTLVILEQHVAAWIAQAQARSCEST